jgi:hypothetical protein
MLEIVSSFPFEFYDSAYVSYLASDRQFYIRLDHLSQGLGLDSHSQLRRVKEDEAISDRLVTMLLETPYKDSTRKQEVVFLNIRALPYWLGTIDVKRVKPEFHARIVLYKREFVEAAWFVFRSDIFSKEMIAEVDTYATPAERELAELMANFRDLKKRLDLLSGHTDEELARVGLTIKDLGGRFTAFEARVVGELTINSQEAWLISEMIKSIGTALYETNKSKIGKSEAYARAQEDFKTEFKVHIYSALAASKMQDAIAFLTRRWQFYKPDQPLPEIFRSGHQPSLV